jgi:hypothetical protein
MTTEQKIIRAKVGLLELANVSQACKMMGYSRDSSGGSFQLGQRGRLRAAALDYPERPDLGRRWRIITHGRLHQFANAPNVIRDA